MATTRHSFLFERKKRMDRFFFFDCWLVSICECVWGVSKNMKNKNKKKNITNMYYISFKEITNIDNDAFFS